MCDLGQPGMKSATRLPGLHPGLTMLGMLSLCLVMPSAHSQSERDSLPDAPSALLFGSDPAGQDVQQLQTSQTPSPAAVPPQTSVAVPSGQVPPCPKGKHTTGSPSDLEPLAKQACEDQLQLIVVTGYIRPLTSKQKGVLAVARGYGSIQSADDCDLLRDLGRDRSALCVRSRICWLGTAGGLQSRRRCAGTFHGSLCASQRVSRRSALPSHAQGDGAATDRARADSYLGVAA